VRLNLCESEIASLQKKPTSTAGSFVVRSYSDLYRVKIWATTTLLIFKGLVAHKGPESSHTTAYFSQIVLGN
jgi:hypothetical protein